MAIKSIVQSPYNVRCVNIEYDEKDEKAPHGATIPPIASVLALLAREELDRYWVAEMEAAVPAGVARADMEAIIETVRYPSFLANRERWNTPIDRYTSVFGVEPPADNEARVIGARGEAWMSKAFL